MNKYYVYLHAKPDGTVFYVGKGCGNRISTTGNRSKFWKRIVGKYGFIARIISSGLSEVDAYNEEIWWIKFYKNIGQCRANMTDGGDGVRVAKRWWGDKISASMKGRFIPSGVENKTYKDVITKEQLLHLYREVGMDSVHIGRMFGLSCTTVIERLSAFGIPIRNPGRVKRKVLCNEDGTVFESITEAAKFYGVFRENIGKVLSGKYSHTGGKTFAYVTNDSRTIQGAIQGTGGDVESHV